MIRYSFCIPEMLKVTLFSCLEKLARLDEQNFDHFKQETDLSGFGLLKVCVDQKFLTVKQKPYAKSQ